MSEQRTSKTLPCPFCGEAPRLTERPATEGEGEGFVAFIACFCGGYSARAHQFRRADDAELARQAVIRAWNTRHAVEPSASTGVGDYCTIGPASEQAQKFLLMFEDRDRGVCIYTDEQQARTAFADAESRGWNCHLFGLLRRNAVPPSDRYGRREPPYGYAYRYHGYGGDVLRFNNGQEVNGSKPFETVPYWIGTAVTKSETVAKGAFGGECNRASCKNVPATWMHRELRNKFYCQPCGMWINENNSDCDPPLCGPVEKRDI